MLYYNMDLQGINQAVLDQNSFGRDLQNHNDVIREHNQKVLDTYNQAESSRKESADVDDIWHGVADPLKTGFGLMTLATNLGEAINYERGVSGYVADTTRSRVGNIKQGLSLFSGGGEEEDEPDPTGAPPLAQGTAETQARLNVFGASDEGKDIFDNLSDAQKGSLITNYAQPTPTALTHLQSLKDANTTANGDSSSLLGRVLTEQPPGEPPPSAPKPDVPVTEGEAKSSIPTSLEDVAGRLAGGFGLGEEKAEAVGQIAGKVSGVASGLYAGYEMATGQDKTGLEKASGVLEEVGAGLDVLGSFVPVLEPLGAIATTTGSILSGVDDYIQSGKQATENLAQKTEGTLVTDVAQRQTTGAVGGASKMAQEQVGGSYSF